MTTSQYKNQFLQFTVKTLFVATIAAGIFAWLMRLYGVDVILPWALFFGLGCILFLVGKWLAISIQDAAASDPSTPRVLETFNSAYEAEVFVSKLAEYGIEAKSVGGFVSGFQAESPGYVDVVVPASVFENAKKLVTNTLGTGDEGVQTAKS